MHLFYASDIVYDEYLLNETESRHCIRVLRLEKGDTVWLTDGKGTLFESIIVDDNIKQCSLSIIKAIQDHRKSNFNLHIAASYTKNPDRFEWFVEKATEIGIQQITPLLCDRTERIKIKSERLEKLLISALKQSQQTYLPTLHPSETFLSFVANKQTVNEKYIAYCDDAGSIEHLAKQYQPGSDVIILIGPEGDFTEKEINFAFENNYKPISLGESRLRTETAALYACTCINLLNQMK
ncbi:MAG: 16S rRNA (uracil(1498)-N(3))-methyltransferase [Bacteroidota bacterium]